MARADAVQAVLQDARDQRIELLTSVLSIAEVAYIATEHGGGRDTSDEAAIDELWVPSSPIKLVDVSAIVAREARSIVRQARDRGMRGIRSADAIHLASAAIYQCDRFFTYENETTCSQWNSLVQASVSGPFSDKPQLGFGR